MICRLSLKIDNKILRPSQLPWSYALARIFSGITVDSNWKLINRSLMSYTKSLQWMYSCLTLPFRTPPLPYNKFWLSSSLLIIFVNIGIDEENIWEELCDWNHKQDRMSNKYDQMIVKCWTCVIDIQLKKALKIAELIHLRSALLYSIKFEARQQALPLHKGCRHADALLTMVKKY